ncbi:MAG: type II toxin-antitoxin system HicA family toxin [Nostoc sp. DedQUE12b]|uniref:type II toxin-antitoxin system HicA family toxin n=1 Tax=Nostoc sp. DedQUE12b TaxID=3075398 RepID=UPI002AD28DFD|nr:type II toxin-antitoxin system HicA family toxin [Nostoc sp. DedQUE12b]MDZ8084638.1 type II toxin-antitoxin system HicA family toxin [Nostoc sp. DedQUE12b]
MSQFPSVTGHEVIAALSKVGFEVAIRGNHYIMIHSDGRRTVVPVHSGETIGRGLLAQIIRDCQITREEFRELL